MMPKTIYKISEILNMFDSTLWCILLNLCPYNFASIKPRFYWIWYRGNCGISINALHKLFQNTYTQIQIQMKNCEFGLRLSCYITLVLSVLGFVWVCVCLFNVHIHPRTHFTINMIHIWWPSTWVHRGFMSIIHYAKWHIHYYSQSIGF